MGKKGGVWARNERGAATKKEGRGQERRSNDNEGSGIKEGGHGQNCYTYQVVKINQHP